MLKGYLNSVARKKRWLVPDHGDLSNVLMTGGKLYISPGDYSLFLETYAKDIAAGIEHHVIERATKEVRWYCDLDITSGRFLDLDIVCTIVRCFLSAGVSGPILVLGTLDPKTTEMGVKTGIHLVAPQTRVKLEDCLRLRMRALQILKNECTHVCVNGWEDAFDESVYKNGSLRLVHSNKAVACKCMQKKDCDICKGTGKVDVGRAYVLRAVVDANGQRSAQWEDALKRNVVLLVKKASIRIPTSGAVEERAAPSRAKVAKHSPSSHGRALQELVDVDLCPQHANLVVTDVQRGRTGVWIKVSGSGERYCQNVERFHNSSQVWFDVHETSIRQRCFCKKGSCSRFVGKPLRLNSEGRQFLEVERPSGMIAAFA